MAMKVDNDSTVCATKNAQQKKRSIAGELVQGNDEV